MNNHKIKAQYIVDTWKGNNEGLTDLRENIEKHLKDSEREGRLAVVVKIDTLILDVQELMREEKGIKKEIVRIFSNCLLTLKKQVLEMK